MASTPSDNPRPQLLLIDDDRKLVRLLTAFLEQEGFDTSVAYDGAHGLQLAGSHPWDLIVLDVMLPGIDGHQVLAQLRRVSKVPVLMLTGRGAEDDLVLGLEGGADDYLSKTASSRELVTRARALLRRSAITSTLGAECDSDLPREACVGVLYQRISDRTVTVNGAPIELTQVEFDLLSILIRHRGQVRTRDQLLRELRNREFLVVDRAIDVHVASLRKKLGDDAREARFIRTIRSVGYLLIDPDRSAP